ncbi:MAG: virulence factor BrkB family protein [Alphaproteobacteria bacterium]|nr:virulence factor BrkB family protein [Alphaproteobacteria bacterium]
MTGVDAARLDAKARLADLGRLCAYAWHRFHGDRCLRVAASLSYTTLLALVPLMTIGFAMFSAFPAFQDLQQQVQNLIFENMVPELGAIIQEQFNRFVANTGQLTAIGIVVLAVTALLMFATVESAFNMIWRAGRSRNLVSRLLIFWAILTIGPLLMGASISLSTYIFTLTRMLEIDAFTGPLGRLVRVLPWVLETALFSLMYLVVPNKRVNWRHALIGGAIAALCFEILKRGFALYIANFPAQQTIYGALSTIPLFLVWMYLSWAVVLVGAEIAASLPEYRHGSRRTAAAQWRQQLSIALGVLARLSEAARRGEGGVRTETFKQMIVGETATLEEILQRLSDSRYIAMATDGTWLLARDLEAASFFDLYRDLGLAIETEHAVEDEEPWQTRLRELVVVMQRAEAEILGLPLKDLVLPGDRRAEKAKIEAVLPRGRSSGAAH